MLHFILAASWYSVKVWPSQWVHAEFLIKSLFFKFRINYNPHLVLVSLQRCENTFGLGVKSNKASFEFRRVQLNQKKRHHCQALLDLTGQIFWLPSWRAERSSVDLCKWPYNRSPCQIWLVQVREDSGKMDNLLSLYFIISYFYFYSAWSFFFTFLRTLIVGCCLSKMGNLFFRFFLT